MDKVEETTTTTKAVNEVTTPVTPTNVEGKPTEETTKVGATNEQPNVGENSTQDELNKQFSERAERAKQSTIKAILDKYGCKDETELDIKVKKGESFDGLKNTTEELASVKEELAFTNNGIDPSMKDDIKALFKGKGLELNDENLKKELANPNHSHWKVATPAPAPTEKGNIAPVVSSLGSDKHDNSGADEEEKFARMFGLKGFIHR